MCFAKSVGLAFKYQYINSHDPISLQIYSESQDLDELVVFGADSCE